MTPENEGFVDRLYVLNGGLAVAPDRSVYTPGRWKGERIALCCNAYLIRRKDDWILFDTGIDDQVACESGGEIIAHSIRGIVARTLEDQLSDVGIAPSDVSTVILSHGHFDHVGNAKLFSNAIWRMQAREHEAMFGPDFDEFGYSPALYDVLRKAKIELVEGDLDLFGDGSVQIISTPGHTPGHCSLLVQLKEAGHIIIAADAAHYLYNLEHQCVPSMNSSAEETLASMTKILALKSEYSAELWLNHDTVQMATIVHAPAYFS